MLNARTLFSATPLVALLALAGCQTGPGPGVSGPSVARQTGVEGDWLSTDGVAMSRFTGGSFETLAVDTGNKLATGSYRYADARTIEISVTSIIRQTTSSVNCALVSPQQLNCTSSSGQQFVLVRRQAGA
ncbi:MAG: hypothetical protein M9939_15470 [Mesorhizobium sp.]|nr:hypothetical protein [Mesorhizobium sp.]MCO5162531.1 hypothetical protein [Mesorhizobium sp.]